MLYHLLNLKIITVWAAMTTVTDYSTPNSGSPLGEVVCHIIATAQAMNGLRVQVNKLLHDFVLLDQDCKTRMHSARAFGGSFLSVPPVADPAVTP